MSKNIKAEVNLFKKTSVWQKIAEQISKNIIALEHDIMQIRPDLNEQKYTLRDIKIMHVGILQNILESPDEIELLFADKVITVKQEDADPYKTG